MSVTNILVDSPTVGEKVKRLMGLNGLTQAEVAEILRCSRSTVSQKCTGRIAFSANEINELAELLHVSADVLLGRAPLEVK
ncbi:MULTISPECIES: helix-turn-helix transcriptional regulator [Bifidobacterium]|uniref:helix-turn-helix transcriptional regulator n=1 Tax=Bifidobacterium TaxID=1678 RepID=UPI00125F6984|nr:helix-turn-helix transcriptional regulator [Bifidobacterium adolescentis]